MNGGQRAEASLGRAFARLLLEPLALAMFSALVSRGFDGPWWSSGYVASLAIPLLILPTVVCFFLVPRSIGWTSAEFQLCPLLGRVETLPWSRLSSFGHGRGDWFFTLAFSELGSFTVYKGAFARAEWEKFQAFLEANHSGKKAPRWTWTRTR